MPGLRLTPDAQADLVAIRRFTLARWGEDQSRKYLAALRQAMRLLPETPALSRNRPDNQLNHRSME